MVGFGEDVDVAGFGGVPRGRFRLDFLLNGRKPPG
jgi:hypothetical protein